MTIRPSVIMLAALLIAGCGTQFSDEPTVAVVVAGTNRGEGYSKNSVAGYDAAWEMTYRADLPAFHISSAAFDRHGRLWLGEGSSDRSDGRVVSIWDPDEMVGEIGVGPVPEAGIVAFAGRMAVGSVETGFGFSIWSIGVDELDAREEFRVDDLPGSFLYLTSIAATEDHLVAAAIHDDPADPDETHTTLWWFDPSFELAGALDLGPGTTVWSLTALPDGRVLALDNAAFLAAGADLLFFDPASGVVVDELAGSGYGFKAAVDGDRLFVLDRIWSSIHVDERRSLTVVDARRITRLPLPDDLGAEDIAVADGMLHLAVWTRGQNDPDGIYRVDESGEITQVVHHEDASMILFRGREN